MKIYDCITFFNEVDLLRARIEYLYRYVDRFLISESTYTHSGQPKPLNFQLNNKVFHPFSDKITYVIHDPDVNSLIQGGKPLRYDPNHWCWTLERAQRDLLRSELVKLDSDAVAMVCDLDEFWNPTFIKNIKVEVAETGACRLGMSFHYYYANYLGCGARNAIWSHPFAIYNRLLTDQDSISLSLVRESGKNLKVINGAGWHFSYLGGGQKIKEKLNAFAHQELNNEKFADAEHLNRCIREGHDLFGRQGHEWKKCNFNYFPPDLINVLEKYPNFLAR